jgi:hypothetical protein
MSSCVYNRLRRLEEVRAEVERVTGGVVVGILERAGYVDVTVRMKK